METLDLELIGKIHNLFKSKRLRLSIAESCTGGLISHTLTSLPGASAFFDSAVIAYSAESKKKFLGISRSFIKKHGVISEEAARAMAEAIRAETEADFSLAVTGNLGPETMEDKKVGLIFIAVSFEKETTSRGYIFTGSREKIKSLAATAGLEFLHEAVSLWT